MAEDLPDPFYIIEAVRNHKGTAPDRHFFIKWEDYPELNNTWEPEDSLYTIDVVKEYCSDRCLEAPVAPWIVEERQQQERQRKEELRRKTATMAQENSAREDSPEIPMDPRYKMRKTMPSSSSMTPPRSRSVSSEGSAEIPCTSKPAKFVPTRSRSRSSSFDNDGNEEAEEETFFAVRNVVRMKGVEPDRLFFVHWEGYESEDNTWEPESGVGHLDVIQEYLEGRKADEEVRRKTKEKLKRKLSEQEKRESKKVGKEKVIPRAVWRSTFKIPKKTKDGKEVKEMSPDDGENEENYDEFATDKQIHKMELKDDVKMVKLTFGQVPHLPVAQTSRNRTLLPDDNDTSSISFLRSANEDRFGGLYQRLKFLRGEIICRKSEGEVPPVTARGHLFETAMEELANRNWIKPERVPEVVGDYTDYWKNELLKNHTRAMLATDPQKMLQDEASEVPYSLKKLLKDPEVMVHLGRDVMNHAKEKGRQQTQRVLKQVTRPPRFIDPC